MTNLFYILDKINIHLYSFYKKIFYKLKYGRKIKIGKKVIFRKYVIIRIEKDGYLQIGNDNFFNSFTTINVLNKIIIGNNNRFGENVHIYDHNHKISENTWDKYTISEILIGNHNWICTNCVLLKGCSIGCNNVIGASNVIDYIIEDKFIIKNGKKEKIK